jgi:DNA-binding PadR family transcriptional regulator
MRHPHDQHDPHHDDHRRGVPRRGGHGPDEHGDGPDHGGPFRGGRGRRWGGPGEHAFGHGPGPDDAPGRGRGDGPPWGRGPRARRGDIRTALLAALTDGPGHGYELIQRLEQRSGGRWRPSPGSVYPTLQLLEDEGLASVTELDGKRTYALTEAGAAEAAARTDGPDGPPWAREGAEQHHALRGSVDALHQAARQVAQVGRPDQVAASVQIVDEARRKLYQLLAEG